MPPNILWIVLEDVSPRLGCYGDEVADTPRIDALADQSRQYNRMFSTTGICAPSRASLVTGMMPQSIGAEHMRTRTHDVEGLPAPYEAVPPHYVTAAPELLRHAGYYCTLDVKTDYQFGEPPTMWDHHDEGAGWWDSARDPDEPFFAMMTNGVTHESGMWGPDQDDSLREGGRVPEPTTSLDAVNVPPYLRDTPETRRAIARQYDNINTLDTWVGELLDRLEADGHAEDTVVIFVGDHGEGLPRKKRWPYDTGTHVPLIVRWPDVIEPGTSDRLVSGSDIAPTTLSIAGVNPPRYMDGRAFLGPYEESPRETIVTTRDRVDESYDMVRSIRDERFRYVRHYAPDLPNLLHIPYRDRHPAMQALLRAHARGELDEDTGWVARSRTHEELYDLAQDPHEMENLAKDPAHADELDRLREALDAWRREVGDEAEPEAEMRARMWPDSGQPDTTAPTFVVRGPRGSRVRLSANQTVDGPITVGLYSPTQGASLAWQFGEDRWRVYDRPRRVEGPASHRVRARAVRYGYEPSEIVELDLQVL